MVISLVKHTRPVSAKTPKVINGKPYYPSVEEVMALLHADRANVIERLTSDDSEQRDQHLDVTEPTDIAAVQREQERLRSEVVGRTEPKIAFIDESKDITSGVLPATIRRNSPSGSLSSIDSLDAVPDEELETMPSSTGSPIAGIIRKGNKAKRDSHVTFNESVAFSDGVVGTLKRKQGSDLVSNQSTMPKQKSYFEFPDNNTTYNDGIGTDSKFKVNGTGLESSKDSLILNHYLGRQSKNHTGNTQNYPHVNTSAMATTGVMTYSIANNNSQPGKLTTIAPPELKINGLHVLPNSPRVNGPPNGGNTSQTTGSQSGSSANNTSSKKNPAWKIDDSLQNGDSVNNSSYVSQTNGAGKNNSVEESNGMHSETFVNGNTSHQTHSHHIENKKSDEKPSLSFSSINASMLKDSLEMHNDIRVSQNDSNIPQVSAEAEATRVDARRPDVEKQSSGCITKHAEIPPETPLVPVTKRDFLSKALRSDNNGVSGVDIKSLSYTRTHANKDELSTACRVESSNNKYFGGNSVPSVEQQGSTSGYSIYNQYREDQKESKKVTQNKMDRTGQRLYDNDSHDQSQMTTRDSRPSAHNGNRNKQDGHDDSYSQMHAVNNRGVKDNTASSSTTVVNPYYSSITHPNSHLNQGHQYTSRDSHGIPRPSRTHGESFSAIHPKSKADHSEMRTTQNTTETSGTADQPSYGSTLSNGKQNFASIKQGSADELLKSVQENIERLSMTPLQQGVSRTNSSGVKLAGTHNVGPYPTASEGRHNRTYSDSGRRLKASETVGISPSSENKGNNKSTAIARERKLSNRKSTSNGQKSKLGDARKVNGNNTRFHRSASDSGIANQRNGNSMENRTTPYSNHEIAADTNAQKHPSTYTNSRRVQSAHPNHQTDYNSPAYQRNSRLYGVLPENRGLHPQTNAFERKQRQTSEGLAFLDKTPTDEEINHLWETVRTCLKHEQPQKAASDSVVNNVRYSRSESGPLVGNHYLIDGNAWASKPRSGSDIETQYSRDAASSHLRRQGSLDSLQRRGHELVGYMPPRKGSLLQHRSSTSERRLTSRNSQTGRPPLNPQFLHSLRGPKTSSRGPVKSNTMQADGRSQLSYAEFQAVMQASADINTRNNEGDSQKNSRQNVHQPIIMNYRRKGKEN